MFVVPIKMSQEEEAKLQMEKRMTAFRICFLEISPD